MKKEIYTVSKTKLLLTFMKLGLFSFGGGATMLSLLRDEVVVKNKWMSDEELMEMTGIAESTPGPIAINLATYLGYKKHGWLGSLCATLGVVIPSFVIMFIISLFLQNLMQFEVVRYAFMGIKVGVVFLILKTSYELIKGLKNDIIAVIFFALVAIAMIVLTIFSVDFSAIFYILIGLVLGILIYAIIKPRIGAKK